MPFWLVQQGLKMLLQAPSKVNVSLQGFEPPLDLRRKLLRSPQPPPLFGGHVGLVKSASKAVPGLCRHGFKALKARCSVQGADSKSQERMR